MVLHSILMGWKKITLEEITLTRCQPQPEYRVVGECSRCGKCCTCYCYDIPDQPAEIPPRKGWCEHLDLETGECRIYENRPEGCRAFPTYLNFLRGDVPPECSLKLEVKLV